MFEKLLYLYSLSLVNLFVLVSSLEQFQVTQGQGSDPVFKVDSANASWYQRKGVVSLCHVIEETLARALKGMSIHDTAALDAVLWAADPSETKTEVGGNTITAVSLALHAASAALSHTPLAQSLSQSHQIEKRQTRPVIAVFSPKTTGACDFLFSRGEYLQSNFRLIKYW